MNPIRKYRHNNGRRIAKRHLPVLGKRLFRLAVDLSKNDGITKRMVRDAVKATGGRKRIINGRRSIDAAVNAVYSAANDLRRWRMDPKRIFGDIQPNYHNKLGFPPYRACLVATKKQPPLNERLRNWRENHVKIAVSVAGIRVDTAGHLSVILTNDPENVGAETRGTMDWSYYPKSCKYPKKITSLYITVPERWTSRVYKRGLAVVDGLLTLDAQPMDGAPDGVDLYAAKWVTQGRGYAVATHSGVIAITYIDGKKISYHGDDANAALASLRRKIGLVNAEVKKWRLQNAFREGRGAAIVSVALRQNPDLTVSLDDARKIGACEYGIRAWCARAGLDYDVGKAPLHRVYDAYCQYPLPEARAAIVQALRRQKMVRRLEKMVA